MAFEANKVLLVVDGVRMNNAIYRKGAPPECYYHRPEFIQPRGSDVGPPPPFMEDALVVVLYTWSPNRPFFQEIRNSFPPSGIFRYSGANDEKRPFTPMPAWAGKNSPGFNQYNYSDFGDMKMGSDT